MMWLAHVQLLDSALPIGAFSHSFGLEALVQDGQIRTAPELKEYVTAMLFGSWAPCDAQGIKAVYRYAPEQRWDELWELDQTLHVQQAARETREGMQKMGKRLLQLSRAMYPELTWEPLAGALQARRCIGTHAVVYGWVTYQLDVPLDDAVEGYLYACLTSCVNNAVRLMPIGQTQGQILIAELLPRMREAWHEVADLDPCEFYSSVPGADIAKMRHEALYSRLFMS